MDEEQVLPESEEMQIYKSLMEQEIKLRDDLKTITHIYGKVTASHDYKEFARKTNSLRERVEAQVREIRAKIVQWDAHFKAQAAYQEMLGFEKAINRLHEKYS